MFIIVCFGLVCCLGWHVKSLRFCTLLHTRVVILFSVLHVFEQVPSSSWVVSTFRAAHTLPAIWLNCSGCKELSGNKTSYSFLHSSSSWGLYFNYWHEHIHFICSSKLRIRRKVSNLNYSAGFVPLNFEQRENLTAATVRRTPKMELDIFLTRNQHQENKPRNKRHSILHIRGRAWRTHSELYCLCCAYIDSLEWFRGRPIQGIYIMRHGSHNTACSAFTDSLTIYVRLY